MKTGRDGGFCKKLFEKVDWELMEHYLTKKAKYKKAPRQGIEPWFSDLKSDVLTIERSRNSK